MPPEHRHAYEVIEGPCDLFLDLERTGEHWRHGSVLAEAVEAAACTVVAGLAAEQRLQVRIDTIVLDCDHAAKFSRHLLVRVTSHGSERVLWRCPRDVGAVVARVAELVGDDAAEVIDRCVYANGALHAPPRLEQAERRAPGAARAQRGALEEGSVVRR